jgi:2-dehydro-3-deoxyphosphogluconate aldolase/(4S)-4-hydroxy-2-oxoglutarate aldolase
MGVIPVIRIDDAETAAPLAAALAEGGLPCAEVTFRTDQAEDAIRRIAGEIPGILLGAGTVLTVDQADRAVGAGAAFIVSPGLNPDVVAHCVKKNIPIIPGCVTPSEMERAMGFGLDTVKFFPAEQAGGLAYLKALSAPYGALRFIPTGGISAANLKNYLAFGAVLACGGSWMVEPSLIRGGRYDEITRLCREAALLVRKRNRK